jgi:hypothetical protein
LLAFTSWELFDFLHSINLANFEPETNLPERENEEFNFVTQLPNSRIHLPAWRKTFRDHNSRKNEINLQKQQVTMQLLN